MAKFVTYDFEWLPINREQFENYVIQKRENKKKNKNKKKSKKTGKMETEDEI